jgi:GNAT superfamily N-acetyltransferase
VLELRPVSAGDLDACLALSAEAGWNQNAADWRIILEQGHVVGLCSPNAGPLATAAVLPYGGRFGWICMVLVTASERRRGHATRLMQYCIDWLSARGLVAGLDATPAGREVYRGLGFEDVYGLTRLQAQRATTKHAEWDAEIRPLVASDLGLVAAYDGDRFGADRAPLLAALRERCPQAAFVAHRAGRICGFALAREGRLATQVGPVVADNEAIARLLMAHALASISGPVFIDIADRHREVRSWLDELGFEVQRPYTRMLLGRSQPLDRPAAIVAIAGPEFA